MNAWSNDVALEFLELYRREPILWDPKHPSHRNRCEITDAWHRIQSSLSIQCSVIGLKRKKESLMTSFRMHFKKKLECRGKYRTTWFAFAFMQSFLGERYEYDNLNYLENEISNNASTTYDTPTSLPENSDSPDKRESQVKQPRLTMRQPQVKIENVRTNIDHADYSKKSTEETFCPQKADGKCDKDECDLYGQLLAAKLRRLDEHQRDMAMHDIDNIMFRAKMKMGSSSTVFTHVTRRTEAPPSQRKLKSPLFIDTSQSNAQFEDENIPFQEHIIIHTEN